jgi:hypothetical protein
MYQEAGPCIETPLHAAQAIQEMLLQSHGGVIRVFPAVPSAWRDVAFHDLRAEGAFLVSAVRRDGKTLWVRVRSLAGEPCRIRPALDGPVSVRGVRAGLTAGRFGDDRTCEIRLGKGEEAVLCSAEAPERLEIAPARREPEQS